MDLIAKLKKLIADARAMLDVAEKDNGGVMDEETKSKYDGIKAEIEQTREAIERRSQLDTIEGGLTAAVPRVTENVNKPDKSVSTPGLDVQPGAVDPKGGFPAFHLYARAVQQAGSPGGYTDKRLMIQADAPTNPHKEQGTVEGFEVPTDYRSEIWELVLDEPDLLSLVDIEPTTSNTVGLAADETTPWLATGVQANWANEASQLTETKLDTEGRLVKLHKLFVFVTATDELLEDAPRLQNRLMNRSAQAISWKASEAIVKGSGSGQPLGFKTSKALVTVAKEVGQAPDSLVTDNVLKMFSRLWPAGLRNAVWIMNSNVFPQLAKITIGDQPVWTPPISGLTQAPGGFLLGRPIIMSEQAETLGDKGDIYLIDPKGYYATNKAGGVKMDSSMHLFFDFGVTAFRWTFRLGGEPFLSKPIDKNNGPDTLSHFVTLAERT